VSIALLHNGVPVLGVERGAGAAASRSASWLTAPTRTGSATASEVGPASTDGPAGDQPQ
jgi:hypothetical protein